MTWPLYLLGIYITPQSYPIDTIFTDSHNSREQALYRQYGFYQRTRWPRNLWWSVNCLCRFPALPVTTCLLAAYWSSVMQLVLILCFMIGTGLRIAIVHARWNTKIIDALVSGAVKSLISTGVSKDNIVIQTVPGSYELPVAVQKLVYY